MNPKVSVIIATYNRFDALLKAIESVKLQTYENIEIVVVNDASTDKRYYSLIEDGFTLIHLEKNTKEIFGFPCAGYVRHIGIEKSSGQYISILDDDDYFFDVKISTQINEMQKKGLRICSSDALAGFGIFSHTSSYYFYLQGLNRASIKQVMLENNTYPNEVLPGEFDFDLIETHNFVIHSSVVFERALYDSVSGYKNLCNGQEDHQLLLDMLRSSNCLYLNTPLLCYDTRLKHSLFHKILRYLKSKFT